MSTEAIIRRYGFEFADDGNRDSLPILKKGLGVDATVRHRWSADTLTAGPITQWGPAVGSTALLPGGSSTLTAVTVAGAPAVQFDAGVDFTTVLSLTSGGADALDTPRTVSLMVSIPALPSAQSDAVNLGGGAIRFLATGAVGAWFQGMNVGGSTGTYYSGGFAVPGEWFVVSVVAVPSGLHEISFDKIHGTDPNWETTPARGISSLRVGNSGIAVTLNVADVIVWEEALTRAQRETLADTLPAYYGLTA